MGSQLQLAIHINVDTSMPNQTANTSSFSETPSNVREFPALDSVNRPAVDTAAAAYYLNRKQQTLRCWACHEDGPIRPLRIHGRLAWPVVELRRILGGL